MWPRELYLGEYPLIKCGHNNFGHCQLKPTLVVLKKERKVIKTLYKGNA